MYATGGGGPIATRHPYGQRHLARMVGDPGGQIRIFGVRFAIDLEFDLPSGPIGPLIFTPSASARSSLILPPIYMRMAIPVAP